MASLLHDYLEAAAAAYPDKVAVEEVGDGAVTFRQLHDLSGQVCSTLEESGVRPGDRVGICLRKSIDSVATLFGILEAGAVHVPVDPFSPAARNASIFSDCSVRALFVEERFREALEAELARVGPLPWFFTLAGVGGGASLARALPETVAAAARSRPLRPQRAPSDLAYILYTSGSTGQPKGVMLTHENATSFVDWCSSVFTPGAEDRFSSHAPFHFDLSVLDLYLSIKHAATLVLIDEDTARNPGALAGLLARKQLTVWYCTPSTLSLLVSHGKLDKHDYTPLRLILFAGEVFPVKHLRSLKALLPKPRYFNLYGPTETNVCTFHEVPALIPEDREQPYPIGRVCAHLRGRVTDLDGNDVAPGEAGELVIAGPSVMQGYWNLPTRTADAFFVDDSGRWYRTGDIVVEDESGVYTLVGRRDRMVKRRGYRIELGEIESVLYRHPEVSEAATVALSSDSEVRIKAFYSTYDGRRLSLIDLKQFCADNLAPYMIPDDFAHQEKLPKTSTDKMDYQRLKGM